jgi:hypothetical protein
MAQQELFCSEAEKSGGSEIGVVMCSLAESCFKTD